jgi:ketosteroid isomerase-like protein
MKSADVQAVYAFHDALNAGSPASLATLVADDVEVGGPRGQGRGVDLLAEWIERAHIQLHPQRVFHRGNVVVAEQAAEWRAPDTGDVVGRQTVATMFRVSDGQITAVLRFPDLHSALETADLSHADEI